MPGVLLPPNVIHVAIGKIWMALYVILQNGYPELARVKTLSSEHHAYYVKR